MVGNKAFHSNKTTKLMAANRVKPTTIAPKTLFFITVVLGVYSAVSNCPLSGKTTEVPEYFKAAVFFSVLWL
jgi:hypothetical protein